MYEASALDHLNAKVDTLFQKIDKLSVSVVTPPPVSPPCEVCGIFVQNPERFSIHYVIGAETIGKAMCDLGKCVSLKPLSLCERLGIG